MVEKEIYGNMKWWNAAEEPDNFDALPAAFKEAFDLWSEDSVKNFEKIVALLEDYLVGYFVPENIPDFEDFFEFDGFPEVECHEVQLVNVSFENSTPMPKVGTQATFKVPFRDDVDLKSFEKDLEERDASLYDCISFGWIFDEPEELVELDTTFGDHLGCEALLLGV